jgi:8-oxo-dGTP pyrophosphatase MutT (NUDIX family)
VAIILAGKAANLSICMIRRASFEKDIWSGHIALPGGRARQGEVSAEQTAEREAHEEVGLELGRSERRGSLSDITIRLAGREQPLTLSSVVYFINDAPPTLLPGDEVAEAFWITLADLWNVDNATFLSLRDKKDVMIYPAIRLGAHVVWGVTLRVLTLFSDVIGHPLPHFEEIPGLRR